MSTRYRAQPDPFEDLTERDRLIHMVLDDPDSGWSDALRAAGYRSKWPWQSDKASARQVRFLRSMGAEVPADIAKGEASFLIQLMGPERNRLWKRTGDGY